jgi:hypothetical protein
MLATQAGQEFEIEPENWSAFTLFLRSQTQWNVGGMGTRTGLNYAGVEVVARLSGCELSPDVFDKLQLLEVSTLNELGKKANG